MKLYFAAITLIFLTNRTYGQSTDSIITPARINSVTGHSFKHSNLTDSRRQKKLIVKGNIIIETYNFPLTITETEISDMESSECDAILKRDTTALKNIWLRDFTLNDPQNELYHGKNTVPYYISINRTIEKFTILDNIVYTSGHENLQRLRDNGKVEEPLKRNFSHMWIRKFGKWKLSTKT
jgi:hypothetical protein